MKTVYFLFSMHSQHCVIWKIKYIHFYYRQTPGMNTNYYPEKQFSRFYKKEIQININNVWKLFVLHYI